MISSLWSPFIEHDFMRRALFQCLILAMTFPVVGLLLVTRRLSLLGDSLSHSMLPGVVLAYAIGLQGTLAFFVGGYSVVFLMMVVMVYAVRRGQALPDTALAYLTVFALALGVLLAYRAQLQTEILHLLFGHVLAVDQSVLALTALTGFLTWLAVFYFFRPYVLSLVDPLYFALNVPMSVWRWLGLVALFSLHLTLGFAALGSLMTVGLLIVPTLVGLRWGRGPLETLLLSSVFGAVVSYLGLLLSFHWEWPAGPSIVAIACLGLFLSFFKKKAVKASAATAAVLILMLPRADAATVTTSFSVLGDVVRQLVPADYQVESIVGPGVDVHGYELSAKNLQALKKADLIINVGAGFEPWALKVPAEVAAPAKTLVILEDDRFIKNGDPHFWHDPRTMEKAIDLMVGRLEKTYPSEKSFAARAAAYKKQIADVRESLIKKMSEIPAAERVIFMSHPFFHAWPESVGLTVYSFQNLKGGEPSAKQIAAAIETIQRKKVRALFESGHRDPFLNEISRKTGVPLGGILYLDSLSVGAEAGTYLKLLEFNGAKIHSALHK